MQKMHLQIQLGRLKVQVRSSHVRFAQRSWQHPDYQLTDACVQREKTAVIMSDLVDAFQQSVARDALSDSVIEGVFQKAWDAAQKSLHETHAQEKALERLLKR